MITAIDNSPIVDIDAAPNRDPKWKKQPFTFIYWVPSMRSYAYVAAMTKSEAIGAMKKKLGITGRRRIVHAHAVAIATMLPMKVQPQ